MKNLTSIKSNKDIQKRILFTLLCVTLFRVGSVIPLPIVKLEVIKSIVGQNSIFSLYDLFSGGGLGTFSLFALGITPYITSSIAIQLLTLAIPYLEDLSENGEYGQRKIKKYTKVVGLSIAFIQSFGLLSTVFRSALINDSLSFILFSASILTFGVYLLTVMDNKIEKKGIGKGASIIICISILSRVPQSFQPIATKAIAGNLKIEEVSIIILSLLAIVTIVIAVQEAVRKVSISYARHSNSSEETDYEYKSYLPLKINQSSITPVIFAQTILTLPQMISIFLSADIQSKIKGLLNPNSLAFNISLIALIILFNYFYTTLAFDLDKISNNLNQANGYIPKVRPGEDTAIYLKRIMYRLIFLGNIFLAVISLMPTIVSNSTGFTTTLLGTSLLIIASVATDFIKQIKSYTISGKRRRYFNI